jgi:hypothetical protein
MTMNSCSDKLSTSEMEAVWRVYIYTGWTELYPSARPCPCTQWTQVYTLPIRGAMYAMSSSVHHCQTSPSVYGEIINQQSEQEETCCGQRNLSCWHSARLVTCGAAFSCCLVPEEESCGLIGLRWVFLLRQVWRALQSKFGAHSSILVTILLASTAGTNLVVLLT